MKIITLNANGIRAAQKKGMFEWFKKQQADILCIQETKAQLGQLDPKLFIRVHRSSVINLQFIESVNKYTSSYDVKMKNESSSGMINAQCCQLPPSAHGAPVPQRHSVPVSTVVWFSRTMPQ